MISHIVSLYLPLDLPSSDGLKPKVIFLLPICLFICAAYGLYLWLLPKPIPGIPYNPEAVRLLLGDIPAMTDEVNRTGEIYVWCCKQLNKLDSPICQVFIQPLAKPWVLLADYAETKDILQHRKGDFDTSSFLADGLDCLGSFHGRFVTGATFRSNRKLVQELMSTRFLHAHGGPAAYQTGLELLRLLELKAQLAQGRPFCAKQDFAYASLDVLAVFFFGANWSPTALGTQVERLSEAKDDGAKGILLGPSVDQPVSLPKAFPGEFTSVVYEVVDLIEMTFNAIIPRLSSWWWSKRAWYKHLFEVRLRALRHQVAIALQNMQSGNVQTGLEHMLKQEESIAFKTGTVPDFDSQSLRDEHVQSNLRHVLYETLQDARREDRLPTFGELNGAKLPYLDAVIEEMLRLNNIPNTRMALRDTTVLGHPIKKGTQVFFFPPVGPILQSTEYRSKTAVGGGFYDEKHSSCDTRPDLALFEPKRWLARKRDGDGLLADDVELDMAAEPRLGFGMGPRACWGKRMALIEMRVIVAMLVWEFEFLKCAPSLSSYAADETLARVPKQCYMRIRKI
ncbi:cytochrome P450 [Apiospora arundinis]|uniref:Cytochrome P450 n=1 Tax=Apiospora arundinis TaxID=335852 RepID=A0ABR2HQ27_9PEZI